VQSLIGLYEIECLRPGPFLDGPLKTLADEFATTASVDWWNNRSSTAASAAPHPPPRKPGTTVHSQRPDRCADT
jgi:hypothetical protein